MVNTIKFSEFADADLNEADNELVGFGDGVNIKADKVTRWTTAGRPATPFDGLLGFNTDLAEYEYWDSSIPGWVQLSSSAITDATFILQTPDPQFPNAQALSSLATGILKSTTVTGILSISAALTSIDGLATSANQMIYTTASNTYATTSLTATARTLLDDSSIVAMRATLGLGPLADGQLIIGSTGLDPSLTTLTAGSGVSILNGPGSITISATGSGGTVTSISAGTGITLTPDPIVTTGSIELTVPVGVILGGTGLTSTTANQILYSSANNTIAGLVTANNGILITSSGGVPSISSTLPNAVQDNITRLGIISSIGAPLGGSFGGTGENNGASTIKYDDDVIFSGSFSFTGNLTGATNITFPTSGTLATTSQIPTGAALTKVDDTNVTLTLGGSPSTALLNAASLTLGWTGQLGLSRGGTNASLTPSNGGIIYSTATALAVLSQTATANRIILSGANSAPSWSTATYPATVTANRLLWASSTNTISDLNSAVNGTLVTDGSAIPSISQTLPTAVMNNIPGRLLNVQSFTATGTYTKTSGANTALIKAVGGGGGGGGSGTGAGAGGNGGTTSVGTLISAGGGNGGAPSGSGGATGGTATIGNIAQLQGGGSQGWNASNVNSGMGGDSYFSGAAAAAGPTNSAGNNGGANTGGGASGGGGTPSGAGGGGGAYAEAYVSIPNATYAVTIGAGGTAGAAGTVAAGGVGGSGFVIIYEYT